MNQHGFAPVLVVVAVVLGVGYLLIPKPGGIEFIKEQLTWPRPTPTPTPPPGCYYDEVVCIQAPCPPMLVCPSPTSGARHEPNGSVETTDWKTYTNNQLGISFEYPGEWVTRPKEIASTHHHGVVALDPENQKVGGLIPSVIAVSYWDNPDGLSIKDLDQKYKGARGTSPLYSPTAQKIVGPVGPALYDANTNCEPILCDRILISYKDKVYELTEYYTSVDDPSRELHKEVLNQILSTFRFD